MLGTGNVTYYSSPVQIGALTTWLQVTAGYTHCSAVKTDGTLWTWGYNAFGQLGLGDITNRSSPVQVGALTGWLSVSAGYDFMFAIKTNGTIWSWGAGGSGRLGLGNTTSYSSPKQIGALTTWSKVSAGYSPNAIAIKTDGTLWSWGQNGNGQLGLGNTTAYSSPKQVGLLTTWSQIAAGSYQSIGTAT
jgi:alpha-tubulin suppressor-like RCC1 family protein